MENLILVSKEELIQILQVSLKEVLREEASVKDKSDPEDILDIQEAAQFLKLSINTIYGYTSQSRVPFIKRGKKLYFEKSKLEAWLKEGSRESIKDIENRLFGK